MNKLIFLALSLPLFHWAWAGDEGNNGGQIGRNNIMMGYENLAKYIDLCLISKLCRIDREERELLTKIKENMPEEYLTKEQIRFKSGKKNPHFFVIDGVTVTAKTGDTVGSPIYINTDLITGKDRNNNDIPLSIPQATSLLVHEMGHHHREYNHTALDQLGAKVATIMQEHMLKIPLLPNSNDVMAVVINEKSTQAFPALVIQFNGESIDISEQLKKSVRCSSVFKKRPPFGMHIHNLHWSKVKKSFFSEQYLFSLKGSLALYCEKDILFHNFDDDFSANLSFKVTKGKDKQFKVIKDSVQVAQHYGPWLPFFDILFRY